MKYLLPILLFISLDQLAESADATTQRLQSSCIECHDADVQKAGLRLDNLPSIENAPATLRIWTLIHDRVARGEMPPKKKDPLSATEIKAFTQPLAQRLIAADKQRQDKEGRVPYRRLNRVEYENTIRDLLHIPQLEVKDILPPDPQADGFDNIAEAQDLSYVQIARYLEAAASALDAAMILRPKPETKTDKQLFIENGRFFENKDRDKEIGRSESRVNGEWMVLLRQPNTAQTPWMLHNRFDEPGLYRFKIHCKGVTLDSPGTGHSKDDILLPPTVNHVAALQVKDARFIHFFDVPAEAKDIEFTAWLHGREKLTMYCASLDDRNIPGGSSPPEKKIYKGPGIAFTSMEMEGPIIDQWPPTCHTELFGDLPLVKWTKESGYQIPEEITLGTGLERRSWKAAGGPYMVVSENPEADSARLLAQFMERAYRRPVEASEINRMQALVMVAVNDKKCFHDAMRVGYKAVLCAPDFLFLQEKPGLLDAYALAARLSYFLWRSMPDASLYAAAQNGALLQPGGLHSAAERLLQDERCQRFVTDFTDQWLDQDQIFATVPDRPLYPEYFCDAHLVESQVAETRAYFNEMLSANLPAKSVIASDFVMVNEQLARLYDIEGVTGSAIRKVSLPKDSVRGGFLTQGSIMKVTANGLTTSPVKRGAWVLEHLLGTPAPPPPPNAGAIEPDTRGAITIREQLEKHRADPSCAGCHAIIDPPGFALESFDVMGAYRVKYRSNGKGDQQKIVRGAREVHAKFGPAVDCGGTVGEKPFKDIKELRALLLAEEKQIARNLLVRLMTYATSAAPSIADRETVEHILNKQKESGYRIRDLIMAVIQSHPFTHK